MKKRQRCKQCGIKLGGFLGDRVYCSKSCSADFYKGKRSRQKKAQPVKKWLAQYKLDAGCVDCGYKDHSVALEFDHIPGRGKKLFAVSVARSIEAAIMEIEKCEVRCANCHRVKTQERILRKQHELFD